MGVTRADLIRAAADILDEHACACLEIHRELAVRVADRVGLPAEDALGVADAVAAYEACAGEPGCGCLDRLADAVDTQDNALPDWHPRGRALFWRHWKAWGETPEDAVHAYAAAGFSWACIPIIWPDRVADGEARGRKPNRSDELYRELRARGIQHWAMAYVTPGDFDAEVRDAVDYASQHGAVGLVLDVETEWKGVSRAEVSRCARLARLLCGYALNPDDVPLKLGFTSYGGRGFDKQLHFDAWLVHVNGITIPQHYDRGLRFDPDYPAESQARFRAAGALHIVAGVGLRVVRGKGEERERRRKSPAEIRRHLDIIGQDTWCAWGGVKRPPEGVLEALRGG